MTHLGGSVADARGRMAERRAEALLAAEGWMILARRVRTPCGEIDLIAERGGLLAFVEVKRRRSLAEAAHALSARQRQRLIAAAECWLASYPHAGAAGVRFDVILFDGLGNARRIADAFRVE
jgi:putative endonuclease